MESKDYAIPSGSYAIPSDLLDLRTDSEIDQDLHHPSPVGDSEKNVWFFWYSGFDKMHPYGKRNVRAWHRRLSKLGWTIRVLDVVPGSPGNVGNFLDVADLSTFPQAFIDGTIGGEYGVQHTSDLVRFPLLLRYGGVYADVGMLQIGDLDRLWNETVGSHASPYEVLSYNIGGVEDRGLANYFLASRRDNPVFSRCHRLLLKIWEGKESTEGMHASPLLTGVELMGSKYSEDTRKELSDYIIQGQVITMVMCLADEEEGWDGPAYCAEHVYAIHYMEGSQLINEYTAWDGQRAFDLMSLRLPKPGDPESEDQKAAREIVEGCLSRSFGFKLATGLILKILGETLSSLWRKNTGSDDVPGTYAHWLRHGTIYWTQDHVPRRLDFQVVPPLKKGPLLREQ